MKVLTEQQIKTINDFENYKKMLRTKYCEMQKSMEMLAETIEDTPAESAYLISVVQACQSSFDESFNTSITIDAENALCIKELGEKPTPIDDNEKKNKAIRGLINILSNFSFATGQLLNFLTGKDDIQTLHREKNLLESHIQKVIEIILKQ